MADREVLAAHGGGDFVPGSIKHIRVCNFMTYTDFDFSPSPGVNFVLGLNGSGKSSLVCAMCVGLNGDLKWMQRGNHIADFVKKGTTEALIEITLAGRPEDRRDVVITRIINIERSKVTNTWRVNGAVKDADYVTKLVQEDFHITLNSPCMFLPQEKISDFVKLEPRDLLKHTMSAADRGLYKAFDEAQEMKRQQGGKDAALDVATRDMRKAQDIMERNRAAKQVWEERQELQKMLEVSEKLMPHAHVVEAKAAVKAAEEDLEAIVAEGVDLQRMVEEPKRRFEAATAAAAGVEARVKAAQEALKRPERAVRDAEAASAVLQKDVEGAAAQLQELQKSQKQREEALTRAMRSVKGSATAMVTKLGLQVQLPAEETAAAYTEMAAAAQQAVQVTYRSLKEAEKVATVQKAEFEKKAFDTKQAAEEAGKRAAALRRQVAHLSASAEARGNVMKRRLQAMVSGGRPFPPAVVAYHCYNFLEKERAAGRVRGEVYGPIITTLGLTDPGYATPVENAFPVWVKYGFVFTDQSYQTEISRMKFPTTLQGGGEVKGVTTMFVNPAKLGDALKKGRAAAFDGSWDDEDGGGAGGGAAARGGPVGGEPAWMPSARTKLGECQLADRVVRANDYVLAVLYGEAALGKITLSKTGEASTRYMDHSERGPVLGPGFSLITPNASIIPKLSRGGGVVTSRKGVYPASILTIQTDEAAVARDAAALQAAQEQLAGAEAEAEARTAEWRAAQARVAPLAAEAARLNAQCAEISGLIGTLKGHVSALANAERLLQAGNVDPAVELQRATARVLEAHLAVVRHAAGPTVAALRALSAATQGAWVADAAAAAAKAEKEAAQEAFDEAARKARTWKNRQQAAEAALTAAKNALTRAQVVAQRAAAGLRDIHDYANRVKAVLNKLGVQDQDALPREGLEQLIANLQARVHHLGAEEGAVKAYLEAEADYKNAEARKAQLDKSREDVARDLLAKQTAWHGKMKALLAEVSRGFSAGMTKLGARGQVELGGFLHPSDAEKNDLASFGVMVKVAFHAGQELQLLHSDVQSGGERAVSTMMYLLSLQPVTRLPFRVLDEINQGVDAKNERFLMEELVSLAAAGKLAGVGGGAGGAASSSDAVPGRQLFIISPKLLSDLQHHEDMRTTIIFNGPYAGGSTQAAKILSSFFERANEVARLAGARLAGVRRSRAELEADDGDDTEPEEGAAAQPARRRPRTS